MRFCFIWNKGGIDTSNGAEKELLLPDDNVVCDEYTVMVNGVNLNVLQNKHLIGSVITYCHEPFAAKLCIQEPF